MNEGELRPTTPELRLQDMDRAGIDATVMYGPTDPFYSDDPDVRYSSALPRSRLTTHRPPPAKWNGWRSSVVVMSI
jgi:hypothetical protein